MSTSTFGIRRSNEWLKNVSRVQSQRTCLLFLALTLFLFYTCSAKFVSDNSFNYFIFSQRWLPSACIAYEEKNSSAHRQCVFPQKYQFWSIHGLWPQRDHSFGPFFCNRSNHFKIDAIKPIVPALKMYWPNIQRNNTVESLWAHEWTKHGTCAAVLKSLDNELKYFNTSLNIYSKYNMNNIFTSFVKSNASFKIDFKNLYTYTKEMFGKGPYIDCIIEKRTQLPYLSEVRLCFNKALELIDCDGVIQKKYRKKEITDGMTNCPLKTKIVVPFNVDTSLHFKNISEVDLKKHRYYGMLFDILQIVRFLQWASS